MDPISISAIIALAAGAASLWRSIKSYREQSSSKVTYNTKEAADLLKSGNVEEWNELRIAATDWIPDLSKADLSTVVIPGANFRNAVLDGVNFQDAILDGSDFTSASLLKTIFINASLNGANFERTLVDGAVFQGAKMNNIIGAGTSNIPKNLLSNSIQEDFSLHKLLRLDPESQKEIIVNMNPIQFEQLMRAIFEAQNYKVTMPSQRDPGYDLTILRDDPILGTTQAIVECKAYMPGRMLGQATIRSLALTAAKHDIKHAILATRNDLSKSAEELAASLGFISVLRLADILKLLSSTRLEQSAGS